MPLTPGTALQNGHYVIDALIETAPHGDLYYGTHIAVGLPVLIQVFSLADASEQADLSGLMARLEGAAFSPQSPLPNPFQIFRGDDQTLCLAMGKGIGLPWSLARRKGSPLSPKQALTNIRQVAHSIAWLKKQGIVGFDLLPHYIWLSAGHDTITLTGLLHARLTNTDSANSTADEPVSSLAQLLFSFLTGELVDLQAADGEAIKAQLEQHRPGLSPVIAEAIARGAQSSETHETKPALTMAQWLEHLPDAGAAYQIQPPSPQLARQPTTVSATAKPRRGRTQPLIALAGTALMAAIGGITLGTFWRLNAQSLPGVIQLEPKQSFPDQIDWSGDTPTETFDSPFVPASNAPARRDNWQEPEPSEDFEVVPEVVPETTVETPNVLGPAAEVEFAPADSRMREPGASPQKPPLVPVEALPDSPTPAPDLPLEIPPAPVTDPLDSGAVNFPDADETPLQPSLKPDLKALPITREATSEI
ncbi:MAG: hypothetical protein ACFB0E_08890 [Leptolyngbyaceae cyanobacterium]